MAYYANGQTLQFTPMAMDKQILFFDVTVQLAATQTDDATGAVINILGPFPANTELVLFDEWWVLPSDLDTNATPALTYDLQISSALAGTSPTVLIADSTTAQGGTKDLLDSNLTGTSLSGKYLQVKIETAAATAAAGTIQVRGAVRTGAAARTIDLRAVAGV